MKFWALPCGPGCSGLRIRSGDICAANLSALNEEVGAAIEPEGLAHISLRQENPRMRMKAAPG